MFSNRNREQWNGEVSPAGVSLMEFLMEAGEISEHSENARERERVAAVCSVEQVSERVRLERAA